MINKLSCYITRLRKQCIKCPVYISWIKGKGNKCNKMVVTYNMIISKKKKILTFNSEEEAEEYARKHLKKKTKIMRIA